MRKISSFTLIELIVAMLIASIIFSVCFIAIKSVNSFQVKQRVANNALTNLQFIDMLLLEDFEKSTGITQIGQKTIKLTFRDSYATYFFSDAFIVRQSNEHSADTFAIKSDTNQLSFEYSDDAGNNISAMVLTILLRDKTITMNYRAKNNQCFAINKYIDSLQNEFH